MKENKNEKEKQPKVYEIPAAGSLGLLALGYRGLEMWRKKRDEEMAKSNDQTKS